MKFEWDEKKNIANKHKHGISFEEAQTVFDDDFAIYIDDDEHSGNEKRFIIIGVDSFLRKLNVCYCERGENNEIIRLITAREANKLEIKLYEEGW